MLAEITPVEPDQGNTCVGTVSKHSSLRVHLALFLVLCVSPAIAWEETCTPFHEIYADGEELCNTIFGDAFVYSTDEANAFTMWWFDDQSPNRATAETMGFTVPGMCEVSYFHKHAPSPEGDNFTECHPWKEEACCSESTANAEKLRAGYGQGYEWDRCGPMSMECQRFFVQEACLYECDVTIGLYKKCSDERVANESDAECYQNDWQIQGMPIKASYCNAWYTACRNDYFCGGGNFFDCDAHYWEKLEAEEIAQKKAGEKAIQSLEEEKNHFPLHRCRLGCSCRCAPPLRHLYHVP